MTTRPQVLAAANPVEGADADERPGPGPAQLPGAERRVGEGGEGRDEGALGELLSVAMAGGYVFGEFDVRRLEETSLSATVRGCPLDPHRHGFRTELKAVTYHALSITRNDRVWTARVIFDV